MDQCVYCIKSAGYSQNRRRSITSSTMTLARLVKAVIGGRADEVVDLAKMGLWR